MTKLNFFYEAGYLYFITQKMYRNSKNNLGILWYIYLFKEFLFWKDYSLKQKINVFLSRTDKEKRFLNYIRRDWISILRGFIIKNKPFGFKYSFLKKDNGEDIRSFFQFSYEIFYNDQYCINSFIKNGDTVVDVGGNIGLFSLFVKEIYKNSQIIVFEPEENNFKLLKENLKNYNGIDFYQKAIGNNTGKVKLNISKNMGAHSIDINNPITLNPGYISRQSVELVKLDNILNKKIDVIKIDIEGYEKEAIEGAKNTIVNNLPLIVVAYEHYNGQKEDLINTIKGINRDYKYLILNDQIMCFYNSKKHRERIRKYKSKLAAKRQSSFIDESF